ncbi:MAG: hypothetical protein R3E08_04945 [Thiotrichaceae bacterium]
MTEQVTSPELSQRLLQNTVWKGEYRSTKSIYLTELQIKSVQNKDSSAAKSYIKRLTRSLKFTARRVAGDINTQYLVDEKANMW